MYTHELADALRKLATALRRAPNIELESLPFLLAAESMHHRPSSRSRDDLPIALSALLSLSRVDKGEWIELVQDLKLNIEIRPRDASRDILGKVLKVLEAEPDARERLQRRVSNRESHGSPELAKALSALLSR